MSGASFCGQCGAPLRGAFCGTCGAVAESSGAAGGAAVASGGQQAPTPEPRPQAQQQAREQSWPQPEPRPQAQPQPQAHEQSWPAAAPAPRPAPRRGLPIWVPFVAGLVVVGLATAGVLVLMTRDDAPDEVAAAPTTVVTSTTTVSTAPTSSSTSSSTTSETTDPVEVAREQLDETYDTDVARFSADGHFLVQLSSKWEGIRAAGEATEDGDEIFEVTDIFSGYEMAVEEHGSDVKLLKSTDFGEQLSYPSKPSGLPIWVVVYDPGTFSDRDDATSWCESTYTYLSGDALRNVCYPREASAPHR